MEIPKCKCIECGHEWTPRTIEPLRCPYCKTYDWETSATPNTNKQVPSSNVNIEAPEELD